MQRIALLLTIFVVAACAFGKTPVRKFDPAARARDIAPFIDEQTVAVGHIDLARVDVNAVLNRFEKIIFPDGKAEYPIAKTKKFVKAMLKAGARDVYVIISPIMRGNPPVIVPLRKESDKHAIQSLLYNSRPEGKSPPKKQPDKHQVRIIRNAVVMCSRRSMWWISTMKPHPRFDLDRAFDSAGDTDVQLLLLPTESQKRTVEQIMPQLSVELGGGSSKAITRRLQWAILGANLSQKMSLSLAIKSYDTNSAKMLAVSIDRIMKAIEKSRRLQEFFPKNKKLTDVLSPKVTNDCLVLHLDDKKINVLLQEHLLPALRESRKQVIQIVSSFNLRYIDVALRMYFYDHDTFPPNLQVLVKEGFLQKRTLVSLWTKKKTYVYIRPPVITIRPTMEPDERMRIKPGERVIKKPHKTIVIYEDPATHKMKKTVVLFANGQVEMMCVDKRFHKLVKEAKAASKKAYSRKAVGGKNIRGREMFGGRSKRDRKTHGMGEME